MNTRRALGAALLVGGVTLLIFGLNASGSFASDVSEFFTGQPTDRAIWLIASGAAVSAFGGFLVFAPNRSA